MSLKNMSLNISFIANVVFKFCVLMLHFCRDATACTELLAVVYCVNIYAS